MQTREFDSDRFITIEFNAQATRTVNRLTEETGYSRAELLSVMLALYNQCWEAHKAGLHVGTAADPDELATRFTGFRKGDHEGCPDPGHETLTPITVVRPSLFRRLRDWWAR